MHAVHTPNEEMIRTLAHSYWEEEGQPEGRDKIHWQRAVAALSEHADAPQHHFADTSAMALTDISLIDGIGPKITQMLHEAGITSLQQIAAMTETELAELDEQLELHGRSAREAWIEQAQELLAGQAPRAESDRARV